MRSITQVAVLALVGGAGAAWHLYGDKVGLPSPLELIGMQSGSAQPGGRGVLIHIVDEGIGMPTSELDKIFDVFYQIDRAKMEQQGSGSGLAIAQSIARMHGGELTATSVLGQGSTFTLNLPVLSEAA